MAFMNIHRALYVCVLLCLQCVFYTTTEPERPIKGPCVNDTQPCGDCGPRVQVILRVENGLVAPFFNVSINLRQRQRQLIYFLQDAANMKEEFRFSADFYAGLGYYISSMNKLQADKNHYWAIFDGEGKFTTCGVSSYIPQDKETVSFKFTTLSTSLI